jgi:hypothetical protein
MPKPHAREFVILPVGQLTPTAPLRHTNSELDGLADSISRLDILQPIIVADRNDCRVIAGHGRLAAAQRAGLTHVPVLIAPDLDTPDRRLMVKLDENQQRKGLTPSEIADISARLRPALEAAAAKRQKASHLDGKAPDGKPKRFGGASSAPPKPPQPKVREKLAAATGVSTETHRASFRASGGRLTTKQLVALHKEASGLAEAFGEADACVPEQESDARDSSEV